MSNSYVPNNEHFLKRARNIRNELLNKTDRYFLIDYPISLEQQMIIKTYRQDLRNFINDNKEKILNGEKIEFPKQPDFIDLNIIY
jgi:hypothetical protein